MRKVTLIIAALLLFFSCSEKNNDVVKPDEKKPSEPVITKADNKIIAHRGAWKEYGLPDNSLASFKKAIESKFLGTECDIQITKDNKVIVYHDEKLGNSYIKDLNYDTDIKGVFKLSNQENIPLLEDFLNVFKTDKGPTVLWLDIKSLSDEAGSNSQSIKAAQEAARLIKNTKTEDRVKYIVGRKEVLDASIAVVAGRWELAYMNTAYSAEQFVTSGYTWANFDYNRFYNNGVGNLEALNNYFQKNIRISFYTIDQIDAAAWFLKQEQVYAISTNIPQTLKNIK